MNSTPRIPRKAATTAFVISFLSYFPIFYLIGYDATVEVVGGLVLGVSFAICYGWFGAALREALFGKREDYGLLQLFIFGVGSSIFYQRVFVTAKRWLGNPEWMNDSILSPLAAWLLLFTMLIALSAPNTKEGNVPRKNLLNMLIAVALGGMIAGVSIGIFFGKTGEPAMRGDRFIMQSPIVLCDDKKSVPVKAYCRASPSLLNRKGTQSFSFTESPETPNIQPSPTLPGTE